MNFGLKGEILIDVDSGPHAAVVFVINFSLLFRLAVAIMRNKKGPD